MSDPRFREIEVYVINFGRKFWYMRYKNPLTGKYETRSTRETDKELAEEAASIWQEELRAQGPIDTSKIPWAIFRADYEADHLSGLAEDTISKVDGVFNAVERHLDPKFLGDLTSEKIAQLPAKLRNLGRSETTISGHLQHLRAALQWAEDTGRIERVPKFPKGKRAKKGSRGRVMKGRPVTRHEFVRMLHATPAVVGRDHSPAYRRLLRGIRLSGLRLEESLDLQWEPSEKIFVDLSGDRPVFHVYAEGEKGNRDRILPMAPRFALWLERTPKELRVGPVFPIERRKAKPGMNGQELHKRQVSRMITRIGEKAGVVVNHRTGKFASAQDLRRTFGEEWALKVQPQVLQQIMRHESIETTLRYYVAREAQAVADVLWETHEQTSKNREQKR